MYDYIAVPCATANWLLAQAGRRDAIASSIGEIAGLAGLGSSVLALGAIRLAASSRLGIVALWNNDLLTGKGYERWGLCRLTGEYGILSSPEFSSEVFERFLAVADLRLNGLKLDDRWVHRHIEDDMHTCIAGRGSSARRFTLAFSDKSIDLPGGKIPTVISIAPVSGIVDTAPLLLIQDRKKLPAFVAELTEIVSTLGSRPALDTSVLGAVRREFQPTPQVQIDVASAAPVVPPLRLLESEGLDLNYDGWIASGSPLSVEQRVILESDVILRSPVRIVGPAGSGKTLLMQLMAIRLLKNYEGLQRSCRITFIVHNSAMMQTVKERFEELGWKPASDQVSPQTLDVLTLSDYSTGTLRGENVPVMDPDAYETKKYQFELVRSYLVSTLEASGLTEARHPLLFQISQSAEALLVFVELLVNEFGVAIKGHDLSENKQGYVLSETPLSRLHAILSVEERSVIFDIFERYQKCLVADLGMLDPDDLAITVLGKLSTPLWRLRRHSEGYDFVFVDEAQLFNENEKRLFPMMTKRTEAYVPIALALDEAQALNPSYGAGLGALGFGDLSNEALHKVFRSTPAILKLAFHVIQRSTDLFNSSFPDFTASSLSLIPDDHHLAKRPVILTGGQAKSPGRFVEKVVTRLRRSNLRHICVVVFGDRYWRDVVSAFAATRHPWALLTRRGDRIDSRGPMIVLSKPEYIGGQEFDAVICVGLEEGLFPPSMGSNHALGASFEQRALREMYVVFTRARYRLVIANSVNSNVSPLLRDAIGTLIDRDEASTWFE